MNTAMATNPANSFLGNPNAMFPHLRKILHCAPHRCGVTPVSPLKTAVHRPFSVIIWYFFAPAVISLIRQWKYRTCINRCSHAHYAVTPWPPPVTATLSSKPTKNAENRWSTPPTGSRRIQSDCWRNDKAQGKRTTGVPIHFYMTEYSTRRSMFIATSIAWLLRLRTGSRQSILDDLLELDGLVKVFDGHARNAKDQWYT